MNKLSILSIALVLASPCLHAATVKVTMDASSPAMTLVNKASQEAVNVGEAASSEYSFECPAGEYTLTGNYGASVTGTIDLRVADTAEEQSFEILTNTAYATNTGWTAGNDYSLNIKVVTKEGVDGKATPGLDSNGRYSFLAVKGNSYIAEFIPSDAHRAEGYTTLMKTGTMTYAVTVSGAIPTSIDVPVTAPAGTNIQIGIKTMHYVAFTPVAPTSVTADGDNEVHHYALAPGQQYFFRAWREGGLVNAGLFTPNSDPTKNPTLTFTLDDFNTESPGYINKSFSANSNNGKANVYVNVNDRGHLHMNVGDKKDLTGLRVFQVTNSVTANMFVEPDYHYIVTDLNGNPSSDVITLSSYDTTVDPWVEMTAVGQGTALVTVYYDAISAYTWAAANGVTSRTDYFGGKLWGATWPETTGVFVVTVGASTTDFAPKFTMPYKNDGKYADAEFDTFYYLEGQNGYNYNFTPEGAVKVELAYPEFGERYASYKGFGNDGVKRESDGSYILLLKYGRNIVRLTDADGNESYQVLNAAPMKYNITFKTAPADGRSYFKPGDKLTITMEGITEPVIKLSGIYNMYGSMYFDNGPASAPRVSAGKIATFTIPANANEADGYYSVGSGYINAYGYGDPFGNHRIVNRHIGRAPNFTAVLGDDNFCVLPELIIPLGDQTQTGVEAISDEAIVEGYYNLNGQRLDAPAQGITIVRYTNGTTRKIAF